MYRNGVNGCTRPITIGPIPISEALKMNPVVVFLPSDAPKSISQVLLPVLFLLAGIIWLSAWLKNPAAAETAKRLLVGVAALVGLWLLYKAWVPPSVDKFLDGISTAAMLSIFAWGVIQWMFRAND